MWMRAIKPQFIIDKNGIPLATDVTSPGGSDHINVLPIVDQIRIRTNKVGRPKERPDNLVADQGYGAKVFRTELRKRGIKPQIPAAKAWNAKHLPKGRPPSYQPLLYKQRWKVERTIAWFMNNRRLNVCFERLKYVYKAFCVLAAIIIVLRYF